MKKIRLFVFRVKCLLSIPFYLLFLCYNRGKKLSYELRAWEKNITTVKYKNELFVFIRMFARLKEYRSLFFYRTGFCGYLLSAFIPHMRSLHFVTCSQDLGIGLVLQHGYSTIIWPNKIGKDCQIYHNVTIGRAHDKGNRPTIGDNVKICAGAIVIGNITR